VSGFSLTKREASNGGGVDLSSSSRGTSSSPNRYSDISLPSAPARVVLCQTPLEKIEMPRRSSSRGDFETLTVSSTSPSTAASSFVGRNVSSRSSRVERHEDGTVAYSDDVGQADVLRARALAVTTFASTLAIASDVLGFGLEEAANEVKHRFVTPSPPLRKTGARRAGPSSHRRGSAGASK
jgi:hypothetical protein